MTESALFSSPAAVPAWPMAVGPCEGSPFFGGSDEHAVELAGGFGFEVSGSSESHLIFINS